MKQFLLLILIIQVNWIYGQNISLSTEFKWSDIEKENHLLKKRFIELTPNEFEIYRLKEPYTPTLSDLINDLHVIDINNDGLDDVVFDGMSGGEPREIAIFLNNGNTFSKIFTDYQGITKIEIQNGILTKINIKDWGCCANFIVTTKFYDVEYKDGVFEFNQKMSFKYVENTVLPDKYWSATKTVEILNDNYNLRFSPEIDDKTIIYLDTEPTFGNTIGKLSKNSFAIALGESTDATGRIWFFVALTPEFELKESYLYDSKNEMKSYKCGWISSRFVDIQN